MLDSKNQPKHSSNGEKYSGYYQPNTQQNKHHNLAIAITKTRKTTNFTRKKEKTTQILNSNNLKTHPTLSKPLNQTNFTIF